MALGGGVFTTQNKVLPGTYLNVVSAAHATGELAERGVAAMPLELDWGAQGEVFAVTTEQFQRDSQKIFGYPYAHEKMKGLRDLFLQIRKGYFYRLNAGERAQNTFAAARHTGTRGNDLTVTVAENGADAFDVTLLLDGEQVDRQAVQTAAGLADNDYVVWKKDAALAATAGTALTGGTNGEAATSASYQAFLDKLEAYSFHTLGCLAADAETRQLFLQFTKRMRDECGVKFQTVLYAPFPQDGGDGFAPDYEGVIGVGNRTLDAGWPESAAVYWATGVQAGCAVNRSCTNRLYDGAFTIETPHTQAQLAQGVRAGRLLFHKAGDQVRVLEDINTFTSFTDERGEDLSGNQTVRVIDQIANDIAALFQNKYLGRIPNDAAGRVSLWNDIVSHHRQLEALRAIEGFSADHVTVAQGEKKKSVVVTDAITPVNAMTQLYMTLMIS